MDNIVKQEEPFAFKMGDKVTYQVGDMRGNGVIKGAATIPVAVMGRMFIVEDVSGNLPTKVYPFTHLAVPEIHLRKA
jgi:hypothetical protein